MKKIIIILFIAVSRIVFSQDNIYLPSDSIFNSYSKDSLEQQAAWRFSFIGEYTSALKMWDKSEQLPPKLIVSDSIYFFKFKPVNAIDYIIERAKHEQIIIINEAHHQPYHRVFTKSLLKGLHQQGFNYFGAEALTNYGSMDSLNSRKYPIFNEGYYMREPQAADLIRSALEEGLAVFAYETTVYPDTSGGRIREIEQAKNIKLILDKDPKAKILIHCGFGHLTETPVYGWGKAMAGRLKEMTGIDPFTIDQTRLSEHGKQEYDNPFFKKINLNYDAMFIDSLGHTFYGPPQYNEYDARVYHPRTKWIDGRPNWIFEEGRNSFFINEKITISFPCLVFVYKANEKYDVAKKEDNPAPYDVIELKTKEDKKALSLKTGSYLIIVKDQQGNSQKIKVTL